MFTPQQFDLIERALKSYEQEPIHTGMVTSLIKATLGAASGLKRSTEEIAEETAGEIKECEQKTDLRRRETAKLRRLLEEMRSRASEFTASS